MSGVSGIMIGNVPTKVLTFLGATGDTASATSYTFSGVSIGTASSDRRIIVGVHLHAPVITPSYITTATIGGVSATVVTYSTAGSYNSSSIIIANVPTGTTADIVINLDSTSIYCGIGYYYATGLSSNTAYASSGTDNAVINCMSGGFCVAFDTGFLTAGTGTTWTALTEDYDVDFDGDRISGASLRPTVAPTISTANSGGAIGFGVGATW